MGLLDDEFLGEYDYFYLPVDRRTLECKGLAYINFRSPEKALECQRHFEGCVEWPSCDPDPAEGCGVDWAFVQGFGANVERQRRLN